MGSKHTKSSTSASVSLKRILIIGSTGEGKSSLVNLLVGEKVAKVSASAHGCTFQCDQYKATDDVNYVLADTVGLNEGTSGTVTHADAVKQLVRFGKSCGDGFNLIVFVHRKGRLTNAFENTYKIMRDILFASKVPCILYVSNCELDDPMDQWWKENASIVHSPYYFVAVVCGTAAVSPNSMFERMFATRREETKQIMWTSIKKHALDDSVPITRDLSAWRLVFNIIWQFLFKTDLFESSTEQDLTKLLQTMGIGEEDIDEIIAELR